MFSRFRSRFRSTKILAAGAIALALPIVLHGAPTDPTATDPTEDLKVLFSPSRAARWTVDGRRRGEDRGPAHDGRSPVSRPRSRRSLPIRGRGSRSGEARRIHQSSVLFVSVRRPPRWGLFVAADGGVRRYLVHRDVVVLRQKQNRGEFSLSITDRARPILQAAEAWKQRCLLEKGSVFSEDELWTSTGFQALDRYFVQDLDWGDGDFFQRLKTQLDPAPPDAKKLAAELFWVMYIIVSKKSMSAETKRDQIKRVWAWSGESLDDGHWALGEVLETGLSSPGAAYNTHRWREFRFFIGAMEDWFGLGRDRQKELLADSWTFASWLDSREWAKGRQLRHILLYLLFPSSFERVLTPGHKRRIVEAFHASWGHEIAIDPTDLVDLDRKVYEVRRRLESEQPDREVDFYDQPFREKWDSLSKSPASDDESSSEVPWRLAEGEDEGWFEKEFGKATPWMIGAGDGGRMWSEFRDKGIAAIGSDDLGDLLEYESREAIHQDLASATGRANPFNDSLALWQFSRELERGDVLIAKQGRRRILGYGIVTGDYRYEPDRVEYQNVIPVEWKRSNPVDVPKGHGFPPKTLTSARDFKPWITILLRQVRGDRPGPEKSSGPIPGETYGVKDALDGLFLPQSELTSILGAISRRKNLILQGPPGVGKTFIAKRIAWTLIGAVRPDQVELVQLHQSYAYEDFVQGWRPTRTGGFELRDGAFYSFCKRAEAHPDERHVFILDEINRGNLSRIFGELLMLIEADKRGRENAITLTYSVDGSRFSVPENVYLLGMMNTADRSLAMVDYALRRRFAFATLRPAFGSQAFRDHLLAAGADEPLVDLIEVRLSALNEKIRNDARNLGPGFEVGHSYFVPTDEDETLSKEWYLEIIRTQIEPLLREYWFDQSNQAERMLADLVA